MNRLNGPLRLILNSIIFLLLSTTFGRAGEVLSTDLGLGTFYQFISERDSGGIVTLKECHACGSATCACPSASGIFPDNSPPGLLQRLILHDHEAGSCWTIATDAVLFWRNAPPSRALALSVPTSGTPIEAANARNLDSTPAGGPRFIISHTDQCGHGTEFIYLRAFNFRSQELLADAAGSQYEPANLFGRTNQSFDQATINLGSAFQTFEANARTRLATGNLTFLAGFRWFEWHESFTMTSSLATNTYDYASTVTNSLYGGQIGVDALLLTMPWLTVDSWLKGGAYYNNAVQHTSYQSSVIGEVPFSSTVTGVPAAGSFVGEIGINGSLPITRSICVRFGYTALWLQSIAMATQQLTNQAALSMNGGTVLQGVTLGLEGAW